MHIPAKFRPFVKGIHPQGAIPLFSPKAFEPMRKAGRLASRLLDHLTPHMKPGVSGETIDQIAARFLKENNAIAAPLGYHGFPKSLCFSINNVVCHGIPGPETLQEGDIVNVDVSVIVDGWYGDTSRMFVIGETTQARKRLVDTTYEAMMLGIKTVAPGATLGDIGAAIETFCKDQGYTTVKEYCGHGIGYVFHGEPHVLHYGTPGTGIVLKEGMFFTIEPMVNQGRSTTFLDSKDGWTVRTRDGKDSAQFEHTLGVTDQGCEIFTQSD